MKNLLEYLTTQILGNETGIEVEENDLGTGFIQLNVKINEDYKSRFIGKGGRTIKAINDLLNLAGKKENKRVNIKVID